MAEENKPRSWREKVTAFLNNEGAAFATLVTIIGIIGGVITWIVGSCLHALIALCVAYLAVLISGTIMVRIEKYRNDQVLRKKIKRILIIATAIFLLALLIIFLCCRRGEPCPEPEKCAGVVVSSFDPSGTNQFSDRLFEVLKDTFDRLHTDTLCLGTTTAHFGTRTDKNQAGVDSVLTSLCFDRGLCVFGSEKSDKNELQSCFIYIKNLKNLAGGVKRLEDKELRIKNPNIQGFDITRSQADLAAGYVLGLMFYQGKKYDLADKTFSDIKLRANPEDNKKLMAWCCNLIGQTLLFRDKFAEAARAFEEGLRYSPENAYLNYYSGLLDLYILKDPKGSAKLQKAVQLEPSLYELIKHSFKNERGGLPLHGRDKAFENFEWKATLVNRLIFYEDTSLLYYEAEIANSNSRGEVYQFKDRSWLQSRSVAVIRTARDTMVELGWQKNGGLRWKIMQGSNLTTLEGLPVGKIVKVNIPVTR